LRSDSPPRWGPSPAATIVVYALKALAPTLSLSVVYLPAVLVISAYWGLLLGLLTSLLSAAAFNYFHLPPLGKLSLSDHRDWVALAAFVTVAAVVSAMAELARSREVEVERRRGEADLAAATSRGFSTMPPGRSSCCDQTATRRSARRRWHPARRRFPRSRARA
jgi:two-component system sensor histidine kinase KdpD